MIKIAFALTLIIAAGIAASRTSTTPRATASVGGGVANPWRSPYKIA